MNMIKTASILCICCLFTSCRQYDMYEYKHNPTHEIRSSIMYSGGKKAEGLDSQTLTFIPNFREFTQAFSSQSSKIYAVSPNKDETFYLQKAILRVPGKNIRTVLRIDETISMEHTLGKTGYYLTYIMLFSSFNTEYEQYLSEPKITLEIYYSHEEGIAVDRQIFEMDLIKYRAIAWPT
jgi:hypothetical protein